MAVSPVQKGPIGDALGAGRELLLAAAIELLDLTDAESLPGATLERADALLGVPGGFFYRAAAGGARLVLTAGTGVFASSIGHTCDPEVGLVGQVWTHGRPIAVDDRSPRADLLDPAGLPPVRALVAVPVRRRGERAGVLGLARMTEEARFTPAETALLSTLAQVLSVGLENVRLHALAHNDLYERQRVEEELLDTIARLRRSETDIRLAQSETIQKLANAAEFRNLETGRHLERMSEYSAALARGFGLDEDRVELIRMASTLHDIGKIAIPDAILLKPGPLTRSERNLIQRHAEIGHDLLAGSASEVLEIAAMIALTHHERFDGSGYPHGIAGESIPIEGRIAAVADVFDSIRSDRLYRPAMSLEEALTTMVAGRGTHFDPAALDIFLGALDVRELEDHGARQHRLVAKRGAGKRRRRLDVVDPVRLAEAARQALDELLKPRNSRESIEAAVGELVRGWNGRLIASVYVVEHDRLWVIAQRGYRELVHDGFHLDHGVMARAVRTGDVQLVPDVSLDRDYVPATSGVVSEIAVPFGQGSAHAGVLNIESLEAVLPDETEALVAPLAAALPALLDGLRDGLGFDLRSLTRLFVHASSLRSVSAISELVSQTVGRMLQLEAVQMSLLGDGPPRTASFWRRPESKLVALGGSAIEQLGRVCASHGNPATYAIFPSADLGAGNPVDEQARWVVSFSLRLAGHEIGHVVGWSSSRDFDLEHLETATLLVQHAAALIDAAQTLRREQRAAATDALTGLLNRRGFEERLGEALALAERDSQPVAIVMMDCDGLKEINDRGGHEAGDRALEQLAVCIREQKRSTDIAARYGGDEFVLLLPGEDAEAAAQIAERLRVSIEAAVPAAGRITASFGVAAYPEDAIDAETLFAAADGTLYRAKREGGNRTLVAAIA